MPEISVIVPVYNTEKYLSQCVNSILQQTFKDFELLLVDDGSTDHCGQICDKFAARDSRVKVYHQSNRGQSFARNVAIKEATGREICFVDADDFVHPCLFESLLRPFRSNPNSIVCCDAVEGTFPEEILMESLVLQENSFITVIPNEEGFSRLINHPYYCWTIWGKLIPREIVRKELLSENRYFEDNAIILKWLFRSDSVIVYDKKLYYYRENLFGTTKGDWSNKKEKDYIWSQEERISFYRDHNMYELFRREFSPFLLRASKAYYSIGESSKDYSHELKKRLRYWWKKYSNYSKLSEGERQYLFSVIYPFRESAKEWINHRLRSIT